MLACLDVSYRNAEAVAACLVFHDWGDAVPASTHVARCAIAGDYQPGRFYEREMPALLAVLARVGESLEAVLIDGYVWLGAEGEPGLGARLFEALGRHTAVIGVAKSAFRGSSFAVPVVRGEGRRPLYVTAAGMDAATAAGHVRAMHGAYRTPSLLRAVDRLSRTG